ncbi:MAG: divalent metal cation transporter [Planctomycetota bacterium]|nr:MAG: divalent metal cation transporter [Planctomycetota bacterium]
MNDLSQPRGDQRPRPDGGSEKERRSGALHGRAGEPSDGGSAGLADMSEDAQPHAARSTRLTRWFRAIGPGLVTACVVIGPGSILTSTQVGATSGYSRGWVVVVAVAFMLVYMSLAAKLGVVARRSTADILCEKAGRWLAALVGLSVFFIAATFQFGNNLGVHAALSAFLPWDYWCVLLNVLAIAFLFGFQNLYRVVERLMAALVAVMLLSFAVNLAFARPDPAALVRGLLPHGIGGQLELSLLGLVGTTFVVTAAYYQSYTARFKGWSVNELSVGLIDARVGAMVMAAITLMLMSTAAAVLRGDRPADVADVAEALEPAFGEAGKAIFCVGLFAAAFSSFIVNSMIGGFILADGLGLGSQPTDRWPRLLTVAVLLTGMLVALYVIESGTKPVGAIVAAQAVTVVASPLMAMVLLWLTNCRDLMGAHRNGWITNLLAGCGLLLLLATAWYTATAKVWPAVRNVWAG